VLVAFSGQFEIAIFQYVVPSITKHFNFQV
jgi:hypothetical protein